MSTPTSAERKLLDYLPTIVISDLASPKYTSKAPILHNLNTVALFGDVSGFTALSESLALAERSEGRGAEKLAFYLNLYFAQVAQFIAAAGGDIFKFAGDAMVVLWPENTAPDVPARVKLAVQAGMTIQDHLHNAALGLEGDKVNLSIKIGIGCGVVSVAHLGGTKDLYGQYQFEAICIGTPMNQGKKQRSQPITIQSTLLEDRCPLLRILTHFLLLLLQRLVRNTMPCREMWWCRRR